MYFGEVVEGRCSESVVCQRGVVWILDDPCGYDPFPEKFVNNVVIVLRWIIVYFGVKVGVVQEAEGFSLVILFVEDDNA